MLWIFFLIAIFILLQKNAFGQRKKNQVSCMGSKVPFCLARKCYCHYLFYQNVVVFLGWKIFGILPSSCFFIYHNMIISRLWQGNKKKQCKCDTVCCRTGLNLEAEIQIFNGIES